MDTRTKFSRFSVRKAMCACVYAASGVLMALPAHGQELVGMPGAALMSVALLPTVSVPRMTSASMAIDGGAADSALFDMSDVTAQAQDAQPQPRSSVIVGMADLESLDDQQLGNERGKMATPTNVISMPGMTVANAVTLWDELPMSTSPAPRPQQFSSGSNVQVMRVSYSR